MPVFTQYHLPDGRTSQPDVFVAPKFEAMADFLKSRNCVFECEILRTGEVSLTIETEDADGECLTLAHEFVPNRSGVVEAVEKLIADAYAAFEKAK